MTHSERELTVPAFIEVKPDEFQSIEDCPDDVLDREVRRLRAQASETLRSAADIETYLAVRRQRR